MAGIPVRFKRVTAPLDDLARARLCESSGSEHSPDNSPELADLVDSFMEREGGGEEGELWEAEENKISGSEASACSDSDTREMLEGLLEVGVSDGDRVRRRIRAETEAAWRSIGTVSEGFKRKLMGLLREKGLDAGICKSRWEKSSTFPAGEYEYIDVVSDSGTRYIVEVDLAGEFGIARPTTRYLGLLEAFPPIFVGRPNALKQAVRLMSTAAKESLKCRDMHLPPWRRNGYMMGKWFGSYKRTTSVSPSRKSSDSGGSPAGRRSVGFVGVSAGKNCRSDLGRNEGLRVGNLAVALKGMDL
ncbi:uncharacterized protein LOC131219584 [Magnolia sinica]|uniref:uncharacterized protein LOC131219584 n=1 Tax=Magnolia sinica TaxID=86752 RepID=UPI00265A1E32|nr:uncharacterized protein LOC131219584 [Magnolia sinica]